MQVARPFGGTAREYELGVRKMRESRQRGGELVADHGRHGIRHDEIEADVFELWIGISRLMERVSGADRQLRARTRAKHLPERHR